MYESLYRHKDFLKSSEGLYYSFPLLKVYEKYGRIQKIPSWWVGGGGGGGGGGGPDLTFCCFF